MEMKKCKECGKLFLPKSKRQQYCDAIHYRPCPVCGKPVIAKYLSDPARRCDDCKHIKSSNSGFTKIKSHVAIVVPDDLVAADAEEPVVASVSADSSQPTSATAIVIDDFALNRPVKVKYIGPATCGWIPNDLYMVIFEKVAYGYSATSIEDISKEELVDLHIKLTSLNSVNQYYELA
mgnify:CR=1 FL=1